MPRKNMLEMAKSLDPDEINRLGNSCLSKDEIIKNGIVLTPETLSSFVVSKCVAYLNDHTSILAGDYCSGMGSFISALNNHLPQVKTFSFEQNRVLFELSSKFYSSKQNQIANLDTLFETDEYENLFDLIVGNPPYVRVQNIPYEIKLRLENDCRYNLFLKGSYDLSVAFIAKAIHLLKDGGICGLILPRKVFFSAYGKRICEYLTSQTQVLEFIDFGDNQLFEDKTTYTCVLIFRKGKANGEYSFTYSRASTIKEKQISRYIEETQCNSTVCTSTVFRSFPWEFRSYTESKYMETIAKHGIPMTAVFCITQGFRTGNNKAFLIDEKFPKGQCTRDYVDGTNIKRGYLTKIQKIIWPYQKNNEQIELIPEKVFFTNNSLLYNKLKKSLKNTEKADWYGYSRPQNLAVMYSPKIFMKEMMPRAEFAADIEGTICFSSGYALLPIQTMSSEDIVAWSLILSTEVMEYQYRCVGTNLHSGWFRMYKGHAEKIFLPTPDIIKKKAVRDLVNRIVTENQNELLWEQLNTLVAKHFGLEESIIKLIRQEIRKLHVISMPKILAKSTTPERWLEPMDKYTDVVKDTAYSELTEEERSKYLPVELTCYNKLHESRPEYRTLVTYQNDKKMPIQRWYKYTQGYSMSLVNQLLTEFNATVKDIVFDPFCGGGTTLLTAKNNGINSIGCDVSPLSCWISKIKTHKWTTENIKHIEDALERVKRGYDYGYADLQFSSFLSKAFYPEILAQTMHIRNWIASNSLDGIEKDFLDLALVSIQEEISVMRKHGSHYRFLNDDSHVGVNKLNIKLIDEDADITKVFCAKVLDMLDDISMLTFSANTADSQIYCADIREFNEDIPKANLVITSPPYLNRNNYFSQQKVELSLLHLIKSGAEYTELVKKSFCSHVEANLPEKPICIIPEVNAIIDAVMQQKSNNVKIPHMIAGYFNDLDKLFKKLPQHLARNAQLAFVVANCRWNGVVVPVDHLICRIAEQHGFTATKIIVARMKGNSPQQMREFGRIPVRESIVMLEYK